MCMMYVYVDQQYFMILESFYITTTTSNHL